jgi:hypothetical protein
MKEILFIILFALWFPFFIWSQTIISGSIKNKKGESLAANVTVQAKGSVTIAGFTVTDAQGNYSLPYKGSADTITITASGMNIGKHSKTMVNRTQKIDFIIDENPLEIKEVTVTAPKIKLKGDTLDYLVSAYTDQNDRVIGDVLKKMPGIEVSPGGGISYNGKAINKFYIENLDLLQGRYGIATNNIAAKDVATVQVFENHQPIKALQERLYSDQAAINLKLKEEAKGTLALTGLAGLGYRPWLWNAELVSMFFAKRKQNMSTYKSNNSGMGVAGEFRTHYNYERVQMSSNSSLSVQSPTTPPVDQKRYLYNQSHAITTNHLIKISEDMEFTASALYYDDRMEKEGYSRYEQYLPGDSVLAIEEQISSLSKIHNVELALRLNSNAKDYYLNNALNLTGNRNNDAGQGNTRSNAGNIDETIRQHLDKPAFSIDNTLNLIKNIQNNTYKIYFSAGYGRRPHALTVRPVDYMGDIQFSSLTQHVLSNDFASVLRLSYGLKLGNFRLDYDLWENVDVRNMETELQGERSDGQWITPDDSLKNDLRYNTYQTGVNQNYLYDKGKFRANIQLPLTYSVFSIHDYIPKQFTQHGKWIFNPSISFKYELTPELTFSTGGGFSRSYGGMNASYTGYIMHSYRSLLRNALDRLFESRSGNGNASVSYRNVFEALFINAGFNYNRSWKNMLYGYNYQGIMNVKTTIDQPTQSDGYSVRISANKGLDFWSATVRASAGYNTNKGELLLQDEILNHRSRAYNAGGSFNTNPVSFLGVNYSFSWNQSRSYTEERSERFPAIRVTSQNAQINLFPHKTVTVNFNIEHQYNSAANNRYTTFADGGIKFKYKQWDLELAANNLFNSKQYVSASYSDISTYYYSYNLRPASLLLKVRFKLK